MSKNERTSKRIAAIAGLVLSKNGNNRASVGFRAVRGSESSIYYFPDIRWSDIRALAASCLTQTEDRKENWIPRKIDQRKKPTRRKRART